MSLGNLTSFSRYRSETLDYVIRFKGLNVLGKANEDAFQTVEKLRVILLRTAGYTIATPPLVCRLRRQQKHITPRSDLLYINVERSRRRDHGISLPK